MKKVTILVDQFYKHGGIERLVALKANYWSSVFNYDVTIMSTENGNKSYIYELDKRVKFKDLNVQYNRERSYFSLRNILLFIKNLIQFQYYIFRNKPDIVLVASHIPITYVLPFVYRGKSKIVKEFHATRFYKQNLKSFKENVFRWIESRYDQLVVLSNEERSFYYSKNITVINNPIITLSNNYYRPITEKAKTAVTVVRVAPVKRIEIMIDIWEEFIKTHSDWILHIFGSIDSEYGKKIEQTIKSRKLESSIILKGNTNHVLSSISDSKVVLMTSEQECFPMLILEAFSVGVPVYSFDCPTGPRNIITNNIDGVLIPNNNKKEFVDKLKAFAESEDHQRTLSEAAKKNSENYGLDRIMKLWNEKVLTTKS